MLADHVAPPFVVNEIAILLLLNHVHTVYALPKKGLPVTSSTADKFLSKLEPPVNGTCPPHVAPLLVEKPAPAMYESPSLPGHVEPVGQIHGPGSPELLPVVFTAPDQLVPPLLVKAKPQPKKVGLCHEFHDMYITWLLPFIFAASISDWVAADGKGRTFGGNTKYWPPSFTTLVVVLGF